MSAYCGPRDSYVSAAIGDARILIPFLADDSASASICAMVYNGLTKVDRNLNVIGDLAEKWEIRDAGKTIVFYLRKNVLWHDGEKFTAKDVKFTFETILKPETACPYISNYTDIDKIDLIDDYTVKFLFKQPYAPALSELGMGIIPEHLFKNIKNIRESGFSRGPVGTGPYRFSKWESGQYIILEANKNYFEHAPGIKRYVDRIIPDQTVEFLELASGGIDYMELNPFQYEKRSRTEDFGKSLVKYKYLAPSYTYIGYNLKDPLFQDKRVRQALSYAINKEEIISGALLGLGEACSGPFRKDTAYYNDKVTLYEYNIEKAKNLLKEAGWVDADDDGILEKDGKKFSFTLVTNQGNQAREDAATIIQNQWAKIGVKVEIRTMAWVSFLDQVIDKKNFQAIMLAWNLSLDPDPYSIWHTNAIKNNGLNSISYSNKEVDSLIEEGRREFDTEKRKKIYHEIHRLIAEDAPYTFLFFNYRTPAINKRFKGVDAAPAGVGYNFIDWRVPEDETRYDF
ncbi:MAG: peptide-binding protein [Candidatus Omnitrophica bacterium]|nr:peptide-binding protein [Candidatus Omnitrophota bacterium]